MGTPDLESEVLLDVVVDRPRDVLLPQVGDGLDGHVGVLDDLGDVVRDADAADVVGELVGLHAEKVGDLGVRVDDGERLHLGLDLLAECLVLGLEPRHLARHVPAGALVEAQVVETLHEGARPASPGDKTVEHELVHGLLDGDLADVVLLAELVGGGQLVVRLELAVRDARTDVVGDDLVFEHGNLRSFFLPPLFAFWLEIIPICKKPKIVLDS